MIPAAPGVYLLLLSLPARVETEIGRLRRIDFAPGLYGYAGSAPGPARWPRDSNATLQAPVVQRGP